MTDIATCDFCGSDAGFHVDGGKVYCKSCKMEHKADTPQSVREYMTHRDWVPDHKMGGNNHVE